MLNGQVAWAVVMLFIILFLLGIGVAIENGLNANAEEKCRAATIAMIIMGWLFALFYWLCSVWLSKAKRLALVAIGCDEASGLLQQLALVLSNGSTKVDGVSAAWPQGWSHDTSGGIEVEHETFFTRNVLRILTGFMLWSNIYFAALMCSFVRTAYAAFNPGKLRALFN